jgi:copper chaperone CopZ
MKRIEILYIEGCPNHRPAAQMVYDAIRDLHIEAETAEIEIADSIEAVAHRFLGSPSIRVDGVDIDPAARARRDFGFSCRTYNGRGLPEPELLRSALLGNEPAAACTARVCRGTRLGAWASGGSVLSAMVSSACCWLPLGLIAFGFSAGGLGAFFEQTRPIFLPVSAILLSLGFYFAYFRETSQGRRARFTRLALWIAAAGTASFALMPTYLGAFAEKDPRPTINSAMSTVTLSVDGMTCEGCAVTARQALMAVPGVQHARVLFDEKRATIAVDDTAAPDVAVLINALERAGYKGRVPRPETSSASTTRGVEHP